MGFNGLRESRQAENRAVPPVSTLLELGDRRPGFSQAAASDEVTSLPRLRLQQLQDRERELSASISNLQNTSRRLEQEATALSENLRLPSQWESWSDAQRSEWIVDNSATRPRGYLAAAGAERYGSTRRPQSRNGTAARSSASPRVPQHNSRIAEGHSRVQGTSSHHPLRNRWRADSPINGLGDRVRSPTPGDTWEIMRSTITPDATLPSADSSFASAAASLSFASNGTSSTEADSTSSSANSQHTSREGDRSTSISSVDPDDLVCDDEEEREHEAELAAAIYDHEMLSTEGQERLAVHRTNYRETGRRFACADEPEPVELGFRLLHEALQTSEGRRRIDRIAHSLHRPQYLESRLYGRALTAAEDEERGSGTRHGRRMRGANIMDDEPPSPHPEHYSGETHAAVREAADQVHDYFRRFTADSLNHSSSRRNDTRSPPPRYEPLSSHPLVDTFTSQDSESRPLSPPSARSDRDISDALWSGSETDLEPIRRIVERLAQRDDVPDEWWMSMGLNLSRTRVRSRSRSPGRNAVTTEDRARDGRIERGDSRL